MKHYYMLIILMLLFLTPESLSNAGEYKVGIGDILEIKILKPDNSTDRVTVSPSGDISVSYLGSINVKGKTITYIQQTIQYRLARGYLKYPIITVSLVESRSRNYTVSGEVIKPGTYPLDDNTTVLKAISIAGGFTRFGSKSRVRVLRIQEDRPGYKKIKIDMGKIIDGDSRADLVLEPGDIIVVSEGFF